MYLQFEVPLRILAITAAKNYFCEFSDGNLTDAAGALVLFKALRFAICHQSMINLITVSKTMSTGFMSYRFSLGL